MTRGGQLKNPASTVTFLGSLTLEEPGMDGVLGRLAQKRPLVLVGVGHEERELEMALLKVLDPPSDPTQAERIGLKRVDGRLDLADEMIYLAGRCAYECLTHSVDAFLNSRHLVDIVVVGPVGTPWEVTCRVPEHWPNKP